MTKQAQWKRVASEAGRATITASLCVMMTGLPLVAENPAAKPAPVAVSQTQMTAQEKELHALNRLTWGARPGDLAELQKMGLPAWFERQLNPQSIDDSALEQKLANYPAMKLSTAELVQKFPSPQKLRQMARQNVPLPADPIEHAIYADSMAAYQRQLAAAGADGKGVQKYSSGQAKGMTPAVDGAETDMSGTESATNAATAGAKGKRRAAAVAYTGMEPSAVVMLPPDERMSTILAMSPDQAFAFNRELLPRERLALLNGLSPAQVEILTALQGPIRVVAGETLASRLVRDVYSDRQLEAVMTDFWLNHFNVYVKKNANEPFLLNSYERDTIRPHALGKFEDLLVATAKSPAMLVYLDNWQSIGPDSPAAQRSKRLQQFADKNPNRPIAKVAQFVPKGINENYARELMELHTIGVRCEVSADKPASMLEPSCGSGYTQADVTNVAKVLTGWTIDRPYGDGGGGFSFEESRHERGSKTVLGQTISDNGESEGLQVLHRLATSPATAQFISHKLAVRFVSDAPPQALESRMAATFLKTGGDIKSVLRTMFDSPEFWSPTVYRAKVKTPIEFVVSALRASDATVNNAVPLVQAMERLGMPLYGMQTPNGYSWLKEPWVNTTALVSRMNFSLVLTGNLLPGTLTNWPRLLDEPPTQSDAMPSPQTEAKLETLLLGQPATVKMRATVLEQAAKPGQALEAQKSLALGAVEPSGTDMADGAVGGAGVKVRARRVAYGGGASMTDMAAGSQRDGPVNTMAGLLLGSPEFQRR